MSSQTAEQVQDLDLIVPEVTPLVIDGIPCHVGRLRFREFMALTRVLTAGLGVNLSKLGLNFDDADEFGRDLSALMILALPNALNEFQVFLAEIVKADDAEQQASLARYLHGNPELEPLLEVIEIVVIQERDELGALMGKVRAMSTRIGEAYVKKTSTGPQ